MEIATCLSRKSWKGTSTEQNQQANNFNSFFIALHIKHIRATICEHRVANANTSFNHQEPII